MNFVFLSPHFPPNWYHFVVGLQRAGATVLGIGDEAYDTLRRELREALAEYYRVSDMHIYDQLYRAMGWFVHQHGRIDRLDSLNEYWLETEAALRTDFNIPGIRQEGIAVIKRKSLMKRRFEEVGLVPARGRVCHTAEELRAFIAEVGYPIVAKPDIGVGAARTYKIQDEADVERYLRDKPPVDYIVEEFVNARIVTYDGLVDREGEVVLSSSLVYSIGVMDAVNLGIDLHYWIPREVPEDLEAAGRTLVRAFDVCERPFHFEFFRLDDGSLVPLEVNMRPPGGLTVDMVDYANDIDFYQQWANVVVHGRFEAEVTRPFVCLYVSRRDVRRYALSHDQVLRDFGPLIVHHQRMERVLSAAIGDYGYILRGPDLEPLLEAARAIQAPAV